MAASTHDDFAGAQRNALSMVGTSAFSWSRVARGAVFSGVAGGVTLDLYLWLTGVLPNHGSMLQVWQFIASTVIGSNALTTPQYAWLGLAIHFAISVAWAGGYAYFAVHQPATNRHWLVAGAAYGALVYVFMQLILLGSGHFTPPPTPTAFLSTVIAHVFFFGIPVAYVVRALNEPASKAT
jgi:hypothetical protein